MNKISDLSVTHESFVSLHAQLHNRLRQLILSGRWPHGSRIPSENQLVDHLNISRSTVRLALQHAEVEGLIERIPGRGTFVAYQPAEATTSRLIAFVITNWDSELQQLILNGTEDEAKAAGYRIIFCTTSNNRDELEILKGLQDDGIAGAILWTNPDFELSSIQNAQNYSLFKFPIVLVDRTIDGMNYDCVTSDNYGGASAVVQHFVDLGHRNIVFVTHRGDSLWTVAERYRAYRDVVQAAGLTAHTPWYVGEKYHETNAHDVLRAWGDPNHHLVQQIIHYLNTTNPQPTAVFVVNDYVAIATSRAIKFAGLRIPDDISIAGFDDTDLSVYLEVPLTTVAQDNFEIGRRAARRLFERIRGLDGEATMEFVPTQLRVRMSSGEPVMAREPSPRGGDA